MRKIISFMMITLDGYTEGENGTLDWHQVDEEVNAFIHEQLHTVGTILFGGKTYRMMEAYWTSPEPAQDDPITTNFMTALPKVVVSKTMQTSNWHNTQVINDGVIEKIHALKEQPGKDIFIFGSSDITALLANNGLVDEYRVIINPLLLGKGKSFLTGIDKRIHLQLNRSRVFTCGNVLLYYSVAELEMKK